MGKALKPYINVKNGPGEVFQATHLTVGVDEYQGGKTMFCVVGYDTNHGLMVNLYGSSVLENVISELAILSGQLAKAMEQAAIEKWKEENEIEE